MTLNSPPSRVEFMRKMGDKPVNSSEWTTWLNNLYEFLKVEDWREIGGTGQPAFTNSWANYGGTSETAAFYKESNGRVWLKGLIAGGTVDNSDPYSPAFTLPEGYRPPEDTLYDQVDGTKSPSAVIDIKTNGDVNITKGNNTFISLAGISFRTE